MNALSYDAYGPVSGAEVDIAILRVSPQKALEAIETLSPEFTAYQIRGSRFGIKMMR